MTTKQKNYTLVTLAFGVIIFSWIYFLKEQKKFNNILSFQQCVDAGYFVTDTYPEECKIPGKKFTNPSQISEENYLLDNKITIHDFKNKTYFIDGQPVVFKDGIAEISPIKSTSIGTSTLWQLDKTLTLDINNDTKQDVILLLQNTSASSKKVYISASVSLYNGFTGINGVYVDENMDTINLSTIDSKIVIEYTLLSSKEKKSKYYKFEDGILKEY